MKLIDLSQPIYAGCPNWPGDPPVRVESLAAHNKDQWFVEQLTLTPHTGSHIDAPLHKLPKGAAIDAIPLERFAGLAVLADLRGSRPEMPFTSTWLSRHLRTELEDKIVLLVTGWGAQRGKVEDWAGQGPYVAPDGADWLAEQNLRGVGIDTISIGGTREPQNSRTHHTLLDAGLWIMEDLRLPDELFDLPQPVQFWGLPIHLRGASGSFCRPVVII